MQIKSVKREIVATKLKNKTSRGATLAGQIHRTLTAKKYAGRSHYSRLTTHHKQNSKL